MNNLELYNPPRLRKDILEMIVIDCVAFSNNIKSIGVCGSFARQGDIKGSDVDMVIKFMEGFSFGDKHNMFVCQRIKKILGDQFRKNVDFIDYDVIVDKINNPSEYDITHGYQKMIDDLIWIIER